MASMFTDKEAPGMTVGRGALCPHYLSWPPPPAYTTVTVLASYFFVFFVFLRNVNVMPNTCGSANTKEETSQYFCREEKRVRSTTQYSLRP